jgi:nucleoredoxin
MDSHSILPSSSANFFAGKKYVNNKNEEIPFDYGSKISIIGLFFTGSWCAPCEKFAQELIEVYNDANSKEKVMEIIQVSNEKNEKEFADGITNKPWIFVQYNDNFIDYLVNDNKITYMPVLLIIRKDRNIISDTGRRDVTENGVKTHEKWLKIYKVQKEREKEMATTQS